MLPIAMIIYSLAIFGMTFEMTSGKKTYDQDDIKYNQPNTPNTHG